MKKKGFNGDYFSTLFSSASDKTFLASKEGLYLFKQEALRRQNTPFYFAKGNLFEALEGYKFQKATGRLSSPVSANYSGYGTAPSDFGFHNGNELYRYQFKVGDDPEFILKEMADYKYSNMKFVTTSDQYHGVKKLILQKIKNGTATPEERMVLHNLEKGVNINRKSIETSMKELKRFEGKDGLINQREVNKYIREESFKAFGENVVTNFASVTITNTIISCVFSTIENAYKHLNKGLSKKEALKNILQDTFKGLKHGVVAASASTAVKSVGFVFNSNFLMNSLNSLLIGNSIIDITKSLIQYKKGSLPLSSLLINVISYTFFTITNIAIYSILPMNLFFKVIIAILLNNIKKRIERTPMEEKTYYKKAVSKKYKFINSIKEKISLAFK